MPKGPATKKEATASEAQATPVAAGGPAEGPARFSIMRMSTVNVVMPRCLRIVYADVGCLQGFAKRVGRDCNARPLCPDC